MLKSSILVLTVIICLGFAGSADAQMGPQEFADAVLKAVKSGDFDSVGQLVESSQDLSKRAFLNLETRIAVLIRDDGDEELQAEYRNAQKQLAVIFKLRHKSESLTIREKWFRALDKPTIVKRLKSIQHWNKAWNFKDQAKATANADDNKSARDAFVKSGDISAEIADWEFAAYAAFQAGQCSYDIDENFSSAYYYRKAERYAENGGEPMKPYINTVREGLGKLRTYDRIKRDELIDISLPLEESRKKYEADYKKALEVKIDPKDAGANPGGGALKPPTPAAEYEWVEEKKFKSTKFKPSGLMPFWHERMRSMPKPFHISLGFEKDKQKEAPMFGESAVATYDGKLTVDPDGPGKAKPFKVKLKKGKPSTKSFTTHYEDGTKQKIYLDLMQAPGTEKVLDVEFVKEAKFMRLYVQGRTAVKGKIRGNDVMIVDTDANCKFNDYGRDSVVIGKGKTQRVVPLGRYIMLEQEDGSLYPYEIKVPQKNGEIIRTRPYAGELAPFRFEYRANKKVSPSFILAQGSGEASDFYFELTNAIDQLVWIPATTLTIDRGAIVVGSGRKKASILIMRGRSKAFKVEAGKMNVWQLGKTDDKGFWMEAKATRDLGNAKVAVIEGKSLKVYGGYGEEYFNFLTGRVLPTLEFRKESGEGSLVKRVEMKIPNRNGIKADEVLFPGSVKVKGLPTSTVVLQMKAMDSVLGEITSDWLPLSDE